jgi:nucleotide-binding universal stress UspA family protein
MVSIASLTTLLVPLDGSAPAEAALPYAEALARLTGATVRLLSVAERRPRFLTARSEHVAASREQAERTYLEQYQATVASELQERGIPATATVLVGDPTDEILTTADADAHTLVVMATHGRGVLDRWELGSVADKVLRLCVRPTLMIRPPYLPQRRRTVELGRLLVPLDGSPLAEQALAPASEIAAVAGAGLTLVRVEPWRTERPADPGQLPELAEMEAEAEAVAGRYLTDASKHVPEAVRAETVVLRGQPAATLADFALHERIDLVVMTTHGWGGLRRLVLGSTADRLVRTGVPTLLVRPVGIG